MVVRENLSPARMAEIEVRSRAYRQPGALEQPGTAVEALSTQTLDPLYTSTITAQAPSGSKQIKLV